MKDAFAARSRYAEISAHVPCGNRIALIVWVVAPSVGLAQESKHPIAIQRLLQAVVADEITRYGFAGGTLSRPSGRWIAGRLGVETISLGANFEAARRCFAAGSRFTRK